MTTTFRIGVTRDFLRADGTLGFGDIGLDLLDEAPSVEWEFLVAPHGLCWTDECFRLIGRSACTSLVEVASGRLPQHLVNPQAAEHPRLKEKLNRYRAIG